MRRRSSSAYRARKCSRQYALSAMGSIRALYQTALDATAWGDSKFAEDGGREEEEEAALGGSEEFDGGEGAFFQLELAGGAEAEFADPGGKEGFMADGEGVATAHFLEEFGKGAAGAEGGEAAERDLEFGLVEGLGEEFGGLAGAEEGAGEDESGGRGGDELGDAAGGAAELADAVGGKSAPGIGLTGAGVFGGGVADEIQDTHGGSSEG
jgi:hypothetical protein